METSSGISRQFQKPFVLNEDNLRRCLGLLTKASQDLYFPVNVVFYVERADDWYYETGDIDDVLRDPNGPGARIIDVAIELRRDPYPNPLTGLAPESKDNPARGAAADIRSDSWRVSIDYALRERDTPSVRILAAANDRNWALLLVDQLESQVQRTFRRQSVTRWLVPLLIIPFAIVLAKAVRSANISEIDIYSLIPAVPIIILTIISFVVFAKRPLPEWLATAFVTESAFLWGKEAQSYKEREQNKRYVKWGLYAAFLSSLTASLIVL